MNKKLTLLFFILAYIQESMLFAAQAAPIDLQTQREQLVDSSLVDIMKKEGLDWPEDLTRLIMSYEDYVKTHTLEIGYNINAIVWSPDGSKLASVSGNPGKSVVKIWNANSGELIKNLNEFTGYVNSVTWSPDGTKLAFGLFKEIIIYDVDTEQTQIFTEITCIDNIVWSPDSSRLAYVRPHSIGILDITSENVINLSESAIQSIAWSPDGLSLASSSRDGIVRIWNTNSGELIKQLTGTDKWSAITWSSDGTKLALKTLDHIIIWDTATWKGKRISNQDNIETFALSPDFSKLIFGLKDGRIRIFNAISGELMHDLVGHTMAGSNKNEITSIVWSKDSLNFASGSINRAIKIWNANTGELLQNLGMHAGYNHGPIAWSPDGSKLAYVSCDNAIEIWR